MASAVSNSYVSPEEYLARERKADVKSEYFDGCVYAMAGPSAEHGRLSLDLATELNVKLRVGPCEVFGSDLRVLVHPSDLSTRIQMRSRFAEPLSLKTVGETLCSTRA